MLRALLVLTLGLMTGTANAMLLQFTFTGTDSVNEGLPEPVPLTVKTFEFVQIFDTLNVTTSNAGFSASSDGTPCLSGMQVDFGPSQSHLATSFLDGHSEYVSALSTLGFQNDVVGTSSCSGNGFGGASSTLFGAALAPHFNGITREDFLNSADPWADILADTDGNFDGSVAIASGTLQGPSGRFKIIKVPEPATLGLLAIGLAACALRRRRPAR